MQTEQQIKDYFKENIHRAIHYVSRDTIEARLANEGEEISTDSIGLGLFLNTIKVSPYEVIIRKENSLSVMPINEFNSKYTITIPLSHEFQQYGYGNKLLAMEYTGENTIFKDSKKNTCILESGDYLFTINQFVSEIYALNKNDFFKYYKPLPKT